MPMYSVVFNINWPCHGSQNDYFGTCLFQITSLILTLSVTLDPKDSVIMRWTCNSKFGQGQKFLPDPQVVYYHLGHSTVNFGASGVILSFYPSFP